MRSRKLILLLLFFCQCSLLHAQSKVTFILNKIPAAKDVDIHLFVAGDFNNWDPSHAAFEFQKQDDGTYRLSKSLPRGVYNFKITRGSWQSVECSADAKSIENRGFKLSHDTIIMVEIAGWQDSFKPEDKKHTASANVHIISENFEISQLGRQRRIWIYLPANYGSSLKKYPVIYMHDGQNLFDAFTSGYGEWGIDEIMDKLPAKDQCIIVGIDHGGEHRMTEYNPYDSKFGKAEGDQYVDFLVKALKPYIDKHYHTKTDVKHTTIAGSSMGGLISMYAMLKYPNVFGNGGIFSPSFWIAPKLYDYAQNVHLNSDLRLYFVCGDSESESMVNDMRFMADVIGALTKKPANNRIVIVKGAKHNEKQWNGDFPGFYQWLIGQSGSR